MGKRKSQICTSQERLVLTRAFIATQMCDRDVLWVALAWGKMTKTNMILFSQAAISAWERTITACCKIATRILNILIKYVTM